MTTSIDGFQYLGFTRDEEGQRDYKVAYFVLSPDGTAGMTQVLSTSGLPIEGDTYQGPPGFESDQDQYAYCRGNLSMTPDQVDSGKVQRWKLEFLYSTKPQKPDKQRCLDNPITDPLLEPPKITFGYSKEKEAATWDRFGNAIVNSAHEPIRGAQTEFDSDKNTITIEQNVGTALQGYVLPTLLSNCVNAAPLFGYNPRCLKLTPDSGSREFYGRCNVYYKRRLTFEINRGTWDRWLLDEGTKVLAGDWVTPAPNAKPVWQLRPSVAVDPLNACFDPTNFIRYVDPSGNPSRVVLNGYGLPSGVQLISSGTTAAYQAAVTALLGQLSTLSGLSAQLAISVGVEPPDPGNQRTVWLSVTDAYYNVLQFANAAIRLSSYPTVEVARIQGLATALINLLNALTITNGYLVNFPVANVPVGMNNAVFAAIPAVTNAWGAVISASTGSGSGTSGVETGEPGQVFVSKYDGVDFLVLGIPTSF